MPTEDEMRRIVIDEIRRQGGTYFGPEPSRPPVNTQPAPPMTAGEILGLVFIVLALLAGVAAVFWFWGIWWGIGAFVLAVSISIGVVTDS